MATSIYSRPDGLASPKLGGHHLAYLRAVAEGLPQRQAAIRYLGVDTTDGTAAVRQAHLGIVDRVRTLARRTGDPRWRLIGLAIKPHESSALPPSIDDWAEAQGLGEFGHDELLALHAQAFPLDRKTARNTRLRTQQLALLQRLASVASETALPHHRIDAWFPAHLSRSLMASGLLLLIDLQHRVQAGGRWWQSIPRIGVGKAVRLAQHLEMLMPGSTAAPRSGALAVRGRGLALSVGGTQGAVVGPVAGSRLIDPAPRRPALPDPSLAPTSVPAPAPAPAGATPDMHADVQAVRAWILARAGSEATAKSYRRELSRFLLFLDQRQLTLGSCGAEDCQAYVALLQDVPAHWSAKRTAPLGHEAWSPFAGPLSPSSQRHAVVVVGSCLAWLAATRYVAGNPWVAVRRRAADVRPQAGLQRRAIPVERWSVMLAALETLSATHPAAERMVFLMQFIEATGLRAAELLGARLGDVQRAGAGWQLLVRGQGDVRRVIPLAGQAQRAMLRYLGSRGLDSGAFEHRPALPILAKLDDTTQPLSYRPLYGTMKIWLNKAIDASDLGWADKVDAARASPQWLRHTCGTRALERGVPLAVVGQLLGHADPRTAAWYSAPAIGQTGDALAMAFV